MRTWIPRGLVPLDRVVPELDIFASSLFAIRACLPLRRSMGTDCSRKTLTHFFVVLPYFHEDEAVLGGPLYFLTALFRQRDKFETRSTWLGQRAWTP